MTDIDDRLKEQLSAWLDGELPADEARFLQRRLDNDPALRARFERWQLASACLRGQPVRLMPAAFAERVQAGLGPAAPARARWPWFASAAAAVLMVALLPNMLATDAGPGLPPAADLAGAAAPAATPSFAATSALPATPSASLPEFAPVASAPSSPLPSVRDFPLTSPTAGKAWPRSPVVADERSLQAYLVRHNALAAGDGVGGFLPYVDVVTQEGEASSAPEDRRE
ncbi:sigma-E factor negative regulatory protein [Arenimonas metalli]|uniref:Anti sigma-E protein RseA N-terminal domain-containing protein n=1 Tax=Arenimonas metalli CF5-1 TaxID=1384056 RepID=A0A091B4S0_9GAMM|nr:sigma-E factor negative regulatory protein [Arenimonas metalli]KFN47613.1 hypothetical protein N787_08625 [Arenimonas metalli CF5-1]